MNKIAPRAMMAAASMLLLTLATPARAQYKIQATNITSGNVLAYFGLGDLGGGVGHGTYQLGSCGFNGVNRTYCTTTGSYAELAGSVNPGATGTFTWRMSWAGNFANPIQAASVSPGSNTLNLFSVPNGAFFEVFLNNGLYANLDFGAPDTPNPQGGSLNWQAFLSATPTCTGSPATCSVGDVGLANGSSISSPIAQFDMQLDYPGNVPPTVTPEPTSTVLLASGFVLVGAGYRRRRRTDS